MFVLCLTATGQSQNYTRLSNDSRIELFSRGIDVGWALASVQVDNRTRRLAIGDDEGGGEYGAVAILNFSHTGNKSVVVRETATVSSDAGGGPSLNVDDNFGSAVAFLETKGDWFRAVIGARNVDHGDNPLENNGAVYVVDFGPFDSRFCMPQSLTRAPSLAPSLHPTPAATTLGPTPARRPTPGAPTSDGSGNAGDDHAVDDAIREPPYDDDEARTGTPPPTLPPSFVPTTPAPSGLPSKQPSPLPITVSPSRSPTPHATMPTIHPFFIDGRIREPPTPMPTPDDTNDKSSTRLLRTRVVRIAILAVVLAALALCACGLYCLVVSTMRRRRYNDNRKAALTRHVETNFAIDDDDDDDDVLDPFGTFKTYHHVPPPRTTGLVGIQLPEYDGESDDETTPTKGGRRVKFDDNAMPKRRNSLRFV